MVAGSDSHFAETVSIGVTEIEAEDAAEVFRGEYVHIYLQEDGQEGEAGLEEKGNFDPV